MELTNSIISTPPRRILSFDIGIKNLAFCYLIETPASVDASYQIQEWQVADLMHPPRSNPNRIINVLDDWTGAESSFAGERNGRFVEGSSATGREWGMGGSTEPTCGCPLKGTKNKPASICGKRAKYRWMDDTTATYYCEMHAKMQKDRIIPKKNHDIKWLNKQTKETLGKIYESTYTDSFWKTYTKKFLVEKMAKYYQERSFQVWGAGGAPTTNAKDLDLITIGKHMAQHLDALFNQEESSIPAPTHVIIENQISTIASRMKTIQGELTMYFLLRFPDSHIEYISSRNKLKHFGGGGSKDALAADAAPDVAVADAPAAASAAYRKHKSDAIQITKQILLDTWGDGGFWTTRFLNEKKKKDDLADCFLQGLWYLKHK